MVYLPPDYEKDSDRRYPVLYLQDGQNVFDGATSFIAGKEWRADETAEQLIRAGKVEPLIIVAVYNTGVDRLDEYSPAKDTTYNRGGLGDAYARMLIFDLKPMIDRDYRTLKDAANTGVGGSSLGALVSLYAGIEYSRVFGKVAAVSPAVWWADRDILTRVQALPNKQPVRIWLDTGTNEGPKRDEVVRNARELCNALMAKGWKLRDDLMYLEVPGGEHNESAWAARFGSILEFLFPLRRNPRRVLAD